MDLEKLLICFLCSFCGYSQQVSDSLYIPSITKKKRNVVVYVDAAHNNFHTINNRFYPFANLLRNSGYEVYSFTDKFSQKSLENIKLLVISNALNENARSPFVIPTPSAFDDKEIKAIKVWVKRGGSLFLIADHMPFAGASSKLGKAFDFHFYDSFLLDENMRGIFDFNKENKMLADHNLTNGTGKFQKINSIRTFTGQAFQIPDKAISILKTTEKQIVFLPDTMWRFNKNTKRLSGKELSQGAIMNVGKGRVAVFGEAAMFTAQLAGINRFKVGMNSPEASENHILLLNLIEWLAKE
ncbi:hypothetical protein [uncultured Tenacibaculum sp.]|uniref:hypothetical protein n=1 Tax=uncultured Tenacibaculum sp. TaxID=174713 RepID=UPI002614D03D|nr:hypothetical protein [uncultured Tenacibaculum sp.]